MKIQEMAFVLLAVVFLLTILMLFMAKFQLSNVNKTATEIRETRAVTMLRAIASMPELSCYNQISCIDKDKLKVFQNSVTRNRYSKLWQSSQISEIEVQQIFPSEVNYTIYYEHSDEPSVTYSTFISLCDVKCAIAKLKVKLKVPEIK